MSLRKAELLSFFKNELSSSAFIQNMNPFDRDNPPPQAGQQYKDFTATELFCPNCRQATPVRERLLLVLPDGDLYEYLCTYCGTSLGEKRVKEQVQIQRSIAA